MMCSFLTKTNLWKTAFIMLAGTVSLCFAVPQNGSTKGKMDSVRTWQLPNTANGLAPNQSWHATGSDNTGEIYVVGCDHATNSALYRLYQKDDTLRYVGDAKAASQAVGNWRTNETCQKFHTRPTYYEGKMYVASTDRSSEDNAYLSTRGYHLYAYDIAANTFNDLSVKEPDSVGWPHLQIITLAVDPVRNFIYGAAIPTMEITRYNFSTGLTTNLGRPTQFTQYIYSNRFMFCDWTTGKLFISAGNSNPQWYNNEPAAVYNHLYFWNPSTSSFGTDSAAMPLRGANCLEAGQWNRDHSKCYTCDDKSHVYCYTSQGQTLKYIDSVRCPWSKTWIIDLAADERIAYIGNSDYNVTKTFYMFDLATGATSTLCTVGDLDDVANSQAFITGYDAWDHDGNIYFASCSQTQGTWLTRFNPVRVKVAKNLLPELVFVSAATSGSTEVVFQRTGATTKDLAVLYDATGVNANGDTMAVVHGSMTIAAGSSSIVVPGSTPQFSSPAAEVAFTVIADGDFYLPGAQRSVTVAPSAVLQQPSALSALVPGLHAEGKLNGAVSFHIGIPTACSASLAVYNARGERVAVVLNSYLAAGTHDFSWSKPLREGVYIAKLSAGQYNASCELFR